MKLAVLADIHANFVALQAVAADIDSWQPDLVVVAGDIVNRGPRSKECLEFVQARQRSDSWLVLRGNHEEYVISMARPDTPRTGPRADLYRPVYWTYLQLGQDVSALEATPATLSLTAPDGGEIRITHASMHSNRRGIFPQTPDAELRSLIAPAPPLICVGHTHRPLARRLDSTLVVNAGAAGLPFDGDTRAAYARLEWRNGGWQAQIVRLDYDRARAARDFYTTGFYDEGGALAHLILQELRHARSLMYAWDRKYQAPILAGELTVAQAVDRFLRAHL
ncbi:MAG: metallophosphoesterase family protein [Anaerolineae bacterium]